MKNSAELKSSFYKYLNNELSEQEAKMFLEHFKSGRDRDMFLLLIEESAGSPLAEEMLNKPELTALLNDSFEKINHVIDAQSSRHAKKLWLQIASAAAAIVLVVFGFYLVYNKEINLASTAGVVKNDVLPGKIGATLTLSNGRKIKLADAVNGKVVEEAGITVTKTANGELIYQLQSNNKSKEGLNTLSTANGETYTLILPDKSKVWMNAASSLTYSTNVNTKIRRVKLEGEAYFEVAEDKKRPFVVESKNQEIRVLGTHFNVNSYANEENVVTTLLKGSIKVTNPLGSKILKPGNQSAVNANSILVTEVDTERSVAWKNNKFLFENDDIRYIMRMIERWYNVDVEYVGDLPTEKFGGGLSRFGNVSQVLKILESTGGAHFKIEGKKIIVTK